ncbi:MAG: alpha/beta hydrolase [bacterium]|nr:alpha/beta hydrolase [bacterium]MCP4968784.1 alpha/beta hydrolase [bacterium]
MTSTTSQLMANDGLGLLVRHWACAKPQARILIVHGLGEHSGRYEHVGDYFVDEGFEVVAYDQRGHGASGGDRVHLDSFDEYLDDLELVASEVDDDLPLIIYGHSMGGLVAASYGASTRPQPDLFVMSAPALAAEIPAPLRLAAKVVSRVRPGMYFPSSIKGEQLSRDPSVGEKYFADPLVETKTTAKFGAALMGQMEAMEDKLGRITTPTLVIHGAEDELVPPSASAPLAALPGVERKLFPGLRHETHNEPEQAEVLGFVASWLKDHLA